MFIITHFINLNILHTYMTKIYHKINHLVIIIMMIMMMIMIIMMIKIIMMIIIIIMI